MKVFISWSGRTSKAVAEALRDWLPNVIQVVQPWMSATDIEKGARWAQDLAKGLEQARVGLICLTPDNLKEPWILFEAGALSKALGETFVCPYLLNVRLSDLEGPLVQFQATRATKGDTRKLVHTINKALSSEALSDERVDTAFEVWWPILEERLRNILPAQEPEPRRSTEDMLEEILELVRIQARTTPVTLEEPPPGFEQVELEELSL